MQILDILNSQWMMDIGRLSQIHDIYVRHLAGPKIDFKDFKILKQPENFKIVKGFAIIPISGPLTPKISFFDFFFGGTSFELITKNINEALERKDVKKIILHMDTPGGTVQGSFELSKLIKDSLKIKDIQVFSDGMIASAGMLIAGASSKITISSGTVEVGSIGVITKRLDISQMNEEMGIKVHEFVSGEFKNSFSPNKKLTEKDAEHIQNQVNQLFTMFASEFSENRKIPIENIVNMQGKMFIGKEAIKNGLVDEIGTLTNLINSGVSNSLTLKRGQKMTTENEILTIEMTVDRLKADYPTIFKQINDESFKNGMVAGQKRTLGIQNAAFPDQDDLVKSCIDDPSLSAEGAAMVFNQAQKETIAKTGVQINDQMPKSVQTFENQTPELKVKEVDKSFELLCQEYQTKNSCNHRVAIKAIAKSHVKEHADYIKRINQ